MKTQNFVRWVILGAVVSFLVSKALSSKKGKKAEQNIRGLVKKVSLAVAAEAQKIGTKLNKAKYEETVEQVLAKYLKGQKIAKKAKQALLADLKAAWKEVKGL